MNTNETSFLGHTVKSYDKDLQSISQTLNTMLELVIQSIDMVGQMIKTRDEKLIEQIIYWISFNLNQTASFCMQICTRHSLCLFLNLK